MHEHLLVLLEPRVDRGPVEPHRAAQPLDRGVVDHLGRAWPVHLADAQGVKLERAKRAGLPVLLSYEQLGAHIVKRHVVLRILDRLPDVQSPDRVQHRLVRRKRPDTTRYRLDVARRGDRSWVVAHIDGGYSAPRESLRVPLRLGPLLALTLGVRLRDPLATQQPGHRGRHAGGG